MKLNEYPSTNFAGKPSDNLSEGGNTLDKISGFVGVSYKILEKAEEIVTAAKKLINS